MAQKIEPAFELDINDVFYDLHLNALSATDAVSKYSCEIVNLAIDEKNKTFVGSGEFAIIAYNIPEKKWSEISADADYSAYIDSLKENAKKALHDYIANFISDEAALQFNSDNEAMQEVKKTKSVNESFDYKKTLLENIVITEADDLITQVVGYATTYEVDIIGLPKHPFVDNFAKPVSKKLIGLTLGTLGTIGKPFAKEAVNSLGNALKDILGVKVLTMSGNQYGLDDFALTKAAKNLLIGAVDSVKKKFNQHLKPLFTRRDLSELAENFKRALNDKYTDNLIDVHIYPTDLLLTTLRKQRRINAKVQDALANNSLFHRMEYCIGMLVSDEDENKDIIKISEVLKVFNNVCSTKFGNFLQKIGIKEFTEKHIVKIQEFKTKFKVSRYRLPRPIKSSLETKYDLLSLLFENIDKTLLTEALPPPPLPINRTNPVDAKYVDLLIDLLRERKIVIYIANKIHDDTSISDSDVSIGTTIPSREHFSDAIKDAFEHSRLLAFFNLYTRTPKFITVYNAIVKYFDKYTEEHKDDSVHYTDVLTDLYIFMLPNLKYDDEKSANAARDLKAEGNSTKTTTTK